MAVTTQWIFASLAALLSAHAVLASPPFYGRVVRSEEELLLDYDYVVVGAGASGLTVANRLSEQPCKYMRPVQVSMCSYNHRGHYPGY